MVRVPTVVVVDLSRAWDPQVSHWLFSLLLAGVFLYARRKKSLGSRYAELGSDSTHDSKEGGLGANRPQQKSSRMSLARMAASSILGRRLMRKRNEEDGDDGDGAGTGRGSVFTIESDIADEERGVGNSGGIVSGGGDDDVEMTTVMFNPLGKTATPQANEKEEKEKVDDSIHSEA